MAVELIAGPFVGALHVRGAGEALADGSINGAIVHHFGIVKAFVTDAAMVSRSIFFLGPISRTEASANRKAAIRTNLFMTGVSYEERSNGRLYRQSLADRQSNFVKFSITGREQFWLFLLWPDFPPAHLGFFIFWFFSPSLPAEGFAAVASSGFFSSPPAAAGIFVVVVALEVMHDERIRGGWKGRASRGDCASADRRSREPG